MVVSSDILKQEHEVIERDLIEFQTIVNSINVNYPNLIHLVRKLHDFWNQHEEKEEKFFNVLQKNGFTIPIKKIEFEHGKLRRYRENIIDAINSGIEAEIRKSLERDGQHLIDSLREHMDKEDWIFRALPKHLTG